GQITEAGGPLYLAELVNCIATWANVQYHAGIVRDKAIRRRLIRNTQQLAADAPLEDLEVLQNRATGRPSPFSPRTPRPAFARSGSFCSRASTRPRNGSRTRNKAEEGSRTFRPD
ncbi:MAG TPA: hypothetical protein PK360_07225, partial [bacterium]|nr:hypothetical protein [bacterium]